MVIKNAFKFFYADCRFVEKTEKTLREICYYFCFSRILFYCEHFFLDFQTLCIVESFGLLDYNIVHIMMYILTVVF